MQIKLEFIANIRQWLVIATLVFSHAVYGSDTESLDFQLPADELKQGCAVLFESIPTLADEDSLGTPPHEIHVNWKCDDLPIQRVDTYEIEGGSPKIVTAFIRSGSLIVVEAKWHICSQASDFCGDLYRIFLYQYAAGTEGSNFIRNHTLLANKRTGMEGVKDGRKVSFPLRSKEEINAALDLLEK